MKRKYILSGLFACALTFSACDVDLLDIPQKGVENEENYYQTDEQCESAIAAVYASWRNAYSGRGEKASQYANGFFLKNFLADDFNSGGARSDQVYAQEIYESAIVATNGWVENYYKRLYATIYLANLVIERFDAAESEVKARNIAEAKFFRAICYFELTTLWGTPPLVDRVLKNSEEYKVRTVVEIHGDRPYGSYNFRETHFENEFGRQGRGNPRHVGGCPLLVGKDLSVSGEICRCQK